MKKKSIQMIIVLLITLFSVVEKNHAQKSTDGTEILTEEQKHIVPISAFTAQGDQENLKSALNEGLNAGLSINEIKEVLIHLYAYTGFPRSLNALGTFQSVLEERKEKGIKDEEGRTASPVPANKTSRELGSEVLVELVGTSEASGVREFAPVVDQFLKEHLFGDLFGRDVLDFKAREIATISALASMCGVKAQLESHLNVARNIGFTDEQLKELALQIALKVGRQEGQVISEVLAEKLNVQTDDILEGGIKGSTTKDVQIQNSFSKGNKIESENFTGTVWVNMLAPNDTIHNISMGNVTFEPGARSNWHYHPGGQILIITHGKGYYQEEGKRVQVFEAGEVIKCPPNVKHWHGASPGESMTHTAISTNIDQGGVVWLDKVTDEEYEK